MGLEPTVPDAKFEASIEIAEGVPKVTWSPDLGAERVYRVLGAKELGDTAGETLTALATAFGRSASPRQICGTVWEVVTEETEGDYNFFKVVVEMP